MGVVCFAIGLNGGLHDAGMANCTLTEVRRMSFEAAVHAQALEIDRLALEMTAAAGSGHPSSSMGIGHLVTVLLFHTMRWSPDYPDYPTSDRLVLSEGHAVPAVYAALAKLGVVPGVQIGKGALRYGVIVITDGVPIAA